MDRWFDEPNFILQVTSGIVPISPGIVNLTVLGQGLVLWDLMCSFFFQGIGNLNLSFLNIKLHILTINCYVQVFTVFFLKKRHYMWGF